MKKLIGVAAVALAVGVGGGVAAAGPSSPEDTPGDAFKRTELYFGSVKPDGSEVTPAEFEIFVDKEVTPSFPDGLTRLEGNGQWRNSTGEIIKERSYVLILLYPVGDRAANGEIQEIREDYKRLYEQESVLRADSTEKVSF
ncbi:DUF3574 domain-containing protein [Amycolatopsis sp. YIM 10]|uniref:DUF3574 domain-containing protein n=1 Tax=Amycolatopsis sp. YIM 10 TaxID=2653857 RepID=UPI00128FF961|nr:DUF3574 domain-containing protein [Amycolatopsis sp. YIM 10]QFU87344.1 hypothetical protein YIM_10695 [Amycolatopsis sp. YIM 10]